MPDLGEDTFHIKMYIDDRRTKTHFIRLLLFALSVYV